MDTQANDRPGPNGPGGGDDDMSESPEKYTLNNHINPEPGGDTGNVPWDDIRADANAKHEAERREELEQENALFRAALQRNGFDIEDVLSVDSEAVPTYDRYGLTWETPIPIHSAGTPEPLPLDTLPDWMRAHVESVAGAVQVSADLPTLLTLCAAAGALQKKASIRARVGWTEPLTLWGMGVLPSGARKSPTFSKITGVIEEHEAEARMQVEDNRIRALDKKEILERRLDAAKKAAVKADAEEFKAAESAVQTAREQLESHNVPALPTLWTDDETSESLLRGMAENDGRMLIMSPEGDLLKFMAGRYADGSVLNVYKKAWTGQEAIRDNRITREGNSVPNPALSVAICAQPTVLKDLAQKNTFRGEGLLARFLYVVPPSNVGFRKTGADVPPLDTAAKATYEKRMRRLWEIEPKMNDDGTWHPHILQLEDAARAYLHELEGEVERMLAPGAALDGLEDWGAKMTGQTLRIAAILHVGDHGPHRAFDRKVSATTVERAARLMRALATHMKQAYAYLEANQRTQLAQYVWRRLCDVSGVPHPTNNTNNTKKGVKGKKSGGSGIIGGFGSVPPVSKRDLWQAAKDKTDVNSASDLDAPLNLLQEHNLIQLKQPETTGPGRPPSPKIYINPKAIQ